MATAEHRFTVDSELSPDVLLAQLDESVRARKGRVDVSGPLIRSYSLGSTVFYRLWGAWAPERLMPIAAHLSAGNRGVGSTVEVHLETAEGRYLVYVPAFFRQAKSAFENLEDHMRRVASA
jgi:hypothetical protein